ncbi:hypothetical protein [Hamadaea tsunoensis]|nr:hypothetical protein [Hamadaea tsunoensis]
MVDNEKAALRWFLRAQRDSVLAIVEGLDEDAVRELIDGKTGLGPR